MKIDLNADVGEGYDDDALFDVVSSVNIACGGHAGDDDTMARAIAAAKRRSIAIGAHPGYEDRASMGRAAMDVPLQEVRRQLLGQIAALARVADGMRATIRHVKPHGALYNQAATDPLLAMTIAEALAQTHPELAVVGLAGSELPAAARALGSAGLAEGFADRAYAAEGTLVPRSEPGAVFDDPARAAAQAVALARGEPIPTFDGATVSVRVDTICCHGDTPGAAEIARAVRAALERDGFTIAPAT